MNGELASSCGLQRLPGQLEQRRIAAADQRARFVVRVAEDHRDAADSGGASGSNGSRGSERPSFTGPEIRRRAAHVDQPLHRQRLELAWRASRGSCSASSSCSACAVAVVVRLAVIC